MTDPITVDLNFPITPEAADVIIDEIVANDASGTFTKSDDGLSVVAQTDPTLSGQNTTNTNVVEFNATGGEITSVTSATPDVASSVIADTFAAPLVDGTELDRDLDVTLMAKVESLAAEANQALEGLKDVNADFSTIKNPNEKGISAA